MYNSSATSHLVRIINYHLMLNYLRTLCGSRSKRLQAKKMILAKMATYNITTYKNVYIQIICQEMNLSSCYINVYPITPLSCYSSTAYNSDSQLVVRFPIAYVGSRTHIWGH